MTNKTVSENELAWIWILILPSVAIALYVAFGHPSEYGFYTLARWLITATALVNLTLLLEKSPGLVAANGLLALVFNPIIPLGLGRELWLVLDLIAVLVLVAGGIALMTSSSNKT